MSAPVAPVAAAAMVADLVERAARDGSTCVPAAVVASALRGIGVESPTPAAEEACETGKVLAHPDERLFGHPRWGRLEEQVAELVVELVTRSGPAAVRVVAAPRGSRMPVLADATVVQDASALGLAEAAALLTRLVAADGQPRLVLVGDPAMPFAEGPGRVLADLVASATVPVDDAEPAGYLEPPDGGPLDALVRAVRGGALPVVDRGQREVVVTVAGDADEAVRRTVQLVTASVPRAFGIAPDEMLVLAPRTAGRGGVQALREALDPAGVSDVRTAAATDPACGAAAAVVLVLSAESAGSITRSMLVGAATRAGRHLSVVHQVGPALAEAVARRPHPPRRTRLARLLADALP